MAASALLEDGAWTLAQSRRATERAGSLRAQTLELILTYRPHRVRVIAGSSDLNDAHRRAIVRSLASQPTKTFAGFSRGGVCMLCGQPIKPGVPEYDIEAAAVTMTLDVDCYNLFQQQVAEAESASTDNERRPTRPLDGLTVLVMDDHHDTLDMVEQHLAALGANVLSSDNAKAGLAFAESQVFDAALVELRMPGKDGWWFLRQLRTSETASAQAAVFAVSGEHHDDLGPANGFAGCFLKPVDLTDVVAVLAALPRRSL